MKVSEVIKALNEMYSPNDEIIVEWWSKNLFDAVLADDGIALTDDLWSQAVDAFESASHGAEFVGEEGFITIQQIIDDILAYGPGVR